VRDCDYRQAIDALEVPWVPCEQWKIVRQGDRRDHRVVSPRRRFPTSASEGGGDSPKCACCIDIERQCVEVGLSLLEHGLS
jgi:hypothetical protein